jgi:DNA recombination protein RmuC
MEIIILILLIVAVILLIINIRKKPVEKDDSKSLSLLVQQISELNRTVNSQIGDFSKSVDMKLSDSARQTFSAMRDITEQVTRLQETNKQVMGFTDQLQQLQNILKNPKQRGVLGEYYLETLLKNVMPPGSYQMQYGFANGEIVDAAVFVRDKVIPIDSKFSLENYNRIVETNDGVEKERLEKLFTNDLKNRIVETSKYIRPEEGTMDFAFMFIPHEAIYYDLLINKIGAMQGEDTENLIQRAASKYKVIIVSPTSFLAYLQTVLQGLKALQIEESAKDIQKRVGELGSHLQGYHEYHEKLGKNLGTVVNQYNLSSKEFKKIDKDVLRITGKAIEIENEILSGPEAE